MAKKVTLSSKTLAGIEDLFEEKLFEVAFDMLVIEADCGDEVEFDDFVNTCYDLDFHNEVKALCYKVFEELGYSVESDGTSF